MAEKIKTILITQQDPGSDKNPYVDLAKKHKLKIDYRPFVHVEGLSGQDFRQQRIDYAEHPSVLFTSRNAVDHYFRLAKDLRITVSDASLWSRRRRSQRPRRLAVDPSTGCDDFVLLSLGRRQDNPAAFRDSLRRGMRRQPVLHLVAVRFVQSNWHRLLLYEDSFAQPVVVTPLWPRNK